MTYTIASCDKRLRSGTTAGDQLVSKDYMEYATNGNHSLTWDTSFFFDLYWKKYHQTAARRKTWWSLFAPVVRKVVESSTVSPKRVEYNSIADYLNTFERTLTSLRSSMDVLVTAESEMYDLLWNACGADPDGMPMPGTSWLAYIDYIRPGTAVYVIQQARKKYHKQFIDQGICKTAAVMACNCVISYLMASALHDPHVEVTIDRNTVRQEAEQMYLSKLPGRVYYPDIFDRSVTFESATGVRSPLMTELIQDNQERAMLQKAWDACELCLLKVCQPYSVVITRGMAFDDWYEEQKWSGAPLRDAGLNLYHVIQRICGIGAVPVQESAGGFVLGTMGDDSLMRSWLE